MRKSLLRSLLLTLFLLAVCTGPLSGQQPVEDPPFEASSEAPEETAQVDFANSRQLSAAVADRESRGDTLLTLIVVSRMLDLAFQPGTGGLDDIEKRLRSDRAWLDRLAARYSELPMRGTLLDPASWHLLLQLDQQQIEPGPSSSPLGPNTAMLIEQLFDRSDERLAAALLPEVLPRMVLTSTTLWGGMEYQLSSNDFMRQLAVRLNEDWFDPWKAAAPPAPLQQSDEISPLGTATAQFQAVAGEAVLAGPPDELRLRRLRFELLLRLPGMGLEEARDAEYLLILAGGVEGLAERRYLRFAEALLWVASSMLLNYEAPVPAAQPAEVTTVTSVEPESSGDSEADAGGGQAGSDETLPIEMPYVSPLPGMLSDFLPVVSNAYARAFSEVDPRLNTSLAAVFDVVQYLNSGAAEPGRLSALRSGLADAVAQLVLLIPDMDYYFEQPVRRQIAEEFDVCISIVAASRDDDSATLSRQQFDGCLAGLANMSEKLLNRTELSGDSDGPFGLEQLRRELLMTPGQRVNFTIGYMNERIAGNCEAPQDPIANPLEFATIATMVDWLARQSPVYFQTPENEALLARLRQQGGDLLQNLAQQVDCIGSAGPGVSDPVVRSLAEYRQALDTLVSDLRQAELGFRSQVLEPGADIVLHGDASQLTAYRPDDIKIGPCNAAQVCEMNGELDATRALVGLFPDLYLLADQSRMGEIEICYDTVGWVNRRSEPVRAEDPHVANYYGQLSFDLVGRFRENGQTRDVFGFNFVSPKEYHYLFAAANEEVLGDPCPTEWVGTRIVTDLGGDSTLRVVPDRLTYLAGARSLPSRIIAANWSRNEEWRDRFITGLNVRPYEYVADQTLADRVNQHLQFLYRSGQSTLYNSLLQPLVRGGGDNDLHRQLQEVSVRKALARSYINLFYPRVMLDSDEIRGSLQGYSAVLDGAVLRRFRENKVAVSSINELGLSRLENLQAEWNRLPENVRRSGAIASSLAHAITRLNMLYNEFFVQPVLQPIEIRGRSRVISPADDGSG